MELARDILRDLKSRPWWAAVLTFAFGALYVAALWWGLSGIEWGDP